MNQKNPIIRKALIATLKGFYKRVKYVSSDGTEKHIPSILENRRDKSWNTKTFEDKDFVCGNVKLNGESKPVPRATISYNLFQVDFGEYLNDNIRVKTLLVGDLSEDKTINQRMRFIPITIPITIKIVCSNINETFNIIEAMLEYMSEPMSFSLEHNGIDRLPAQLSPDVSGSRNGSGNINMAEASENEEISFDFTLKFHYPKVLGEKYPNHIGSSDINLSSK
jgi:hypothetical protein